MPSYPQIPSLKLPNALDLPVPILELPTVELPQIEPIFIPQTVQPGAVEDLIPPPPLPAMPEEAQELEDQEQEEEQESQEEPQEESQKEESSSEEQKDQSVPATVIPNVEVILPPIPQTPELPPVQTTPIELPSLEQDEDSSLPQEKLEGVITVEVLGLPVPMPEPEILVAAGATATVSVAATLASTSILKKVISVMKPLVKKIMTMALKKVGKTPPKTWARERLEQRRSRQH